MLFNGQEIYEKLKDLTEDQRRECFYGSIADRGTLQSILETSVADDIVFNALEDDDIDEDTVKKAFNDLTPFDISELLKRSYEDVQETDADNTLWEHFTEALTIRLRDMLTDRVSKKGLSHE